MGSSQGFGREGERWRESCLGLLRTPEVGSETSYVRTRDGKALHRAGNTPQLSGLASFFITKDGEWGSPELGPSFCPTLPAAT